MRPSGSQWKHWTGKWWDILICHKKRHGNGNKKASGVLWSHAYSPIRTIWCFKPQIWRDKAGCAWVSAVWQGSQIQLNLKQQNNENEWHSYENLKEQFITFVVAYIPTAGEQLLEKYPLILQHRIIPVVGRLSLGCLTFNLNESQTSQIEVNNESKHWCWFPVLELMLTEVVKSDAMIPCF